MRSLIVPDQSKLMKSDRNTVLVTSVGTLIGKVVLDSLEGRRGGLHLVGCNADVEAPNLFRCDEAMVVPATDDPRWRDVMISLVREYDPVAVIPGRDPDVEALAEMAEIIPEFRRSFVGGSSAMARVIGNKALTAEFSRRHGLPYVDSVASCEAGTEAAVADLVARHGFPLIAKPGAGSGSLGVRVLTGPEHLEAALRLPGYVIQPFLDAPEGLRLSLEAGLPLFWEIPETRLYGMQFVIRRDGTVGPSIGFRMTMVRGRLEDLRRCDEAALREVGQAFAEAAAAEGWRGPFNVQAKRTRDGSWQVIELNGRFSGGTSSRRHFGFDEVAWVLNDWAGREMVPADEPRSASRVLRYLSDFPLNEEAMKNVRVLPS
ncbi:MAG: hypothetical protein RLZZ179_2591 [Verrucomicrobiota bacterium]